jgi:hypothetical protein
MKENGQGQNRTADTMIFSHVLYQLSYLAQTKNPPSPLRARAGNHRRSRCYRLPAPARLRGLHVSSTVQKLDVRNAHLLGSSQRGKRRPAAALR